MRSPLTINSTNQAKLAEYSRMLGYEVSGAKLPIPELQMEKGAVQAVQAGQYAQVAAELGRIKAINGFKLNNGPVLIEDAWFSLEGFQGQPGPFYSQFESREYNHTLTQIIHKLPMVDGSPRSRKAVGIVTLAMWNGDPNCAPDVWQGTSIGVIPQLPRGDKGFGWDDIFEPVDEHGNPVGMTFAEMPPELKDSYSPRPKALARFMRTPLV